MIIPKKKEVLKLITYKNKIVNENKNKENFKPNLQNNYNINNTINNNLPQKSKQNLNKVTPLENKEIESINSTLNSILKKIKKIQISQLEFREMLANLKQVEGNNYINLDERFRALEKYFPNYNRKVGYDQSNNSSEKYSHPRSKRDFREKKVRSNKSYEKNN